MPSSRDRVRLPRAIGAALGVLALASIPTAGADHNYTEGDIRAMIENTSYCSGDNRFMSCCANASGTTIFLPAIPYEYMWGKEFRAFLYIAGLLWCFLGVSVLSDTFMAGIERITEGTHQVKRKRKNPDGTFALENGQPIFDTVDELIWNPAVANLSLMALGSSTPEILLGIIETIGGGFYAGALGPGTVVGSAAFNLYVITGICMVALEEGETRKVEGVTVFLITATSSLFAYIWLGIVLMVWTPNIVTLEEALITFLFMPLLLVIVWCADNDWFRTPPQQVHPENETEGGTTAGGEGAEGGAGGNGAAAPMKFAAAAAVRRVSMAGGLDDIGRVAKVSYLAHRRAIAAKSSGAAKRSLQEVMEKQRAASAIPGHAEQKHMSAMMKLAHQESFQIQTHTTFHFRSASSAFPKAHGKAQVSIVRGGKQGTSAKIRVQTRDGNVFAPAAFDKFDQVVTFEAHENEKVVEIPYKTDFAWKKDHFFEVLLIKTGEGEEVDERSCKTMVTVVSDNEGDEGNITWSTGVASFLSTDSAAILLMQQAQGLDHTTNVRVLTKSGTAKDGVDFMGLETNVEFRAYETAKTIKIPLVPRKKNDEVNKASEFSVCMWQLSEKGEKIGEEKVVTISIIHSQGGAVPRGHERERGRRPVGRDYHGLRHALDVDWLEGDVRDHATRECRGRVRVLLVGARAHRLYDCHHRRPRVHLWLPLRPQGRGDGHHDRCAGDVAPGHVCVDARDQGRRNCGQRHRQRDGLELGQCVSGPRDPMDPLGSLLEHLSYVRKCSPNVEGALLENGSR